MTYSRHFWYDGHHGEIERVRRALYEARINGTQFRQSSHPSSMMDDMIDEMKYRNEREPDFPTVCHGLLAFLDQHVPGRNDKNDWVLMDSIRDEVVLNDWGLCLNTMYALEDEEYVVVSQAYDTPNSQHLLQPLVTTVPDSEELSDLERIV